MKRMLKKLKQKVGDSFAEVMVALLIAALGASLLATMTMSSTNIITQNRVVMDSLYAAEATLVTSPSTAATSDSVIISGSNDMLSATVDVDVYEEEDFARYEQTP